MSKKVLVLANSSKGVYGFRNEIMLSLKEDYDVVIAVPDEVSVKELKEEGFEIIKTPLNRRGMNPLEDLKLCRTYSKLLKEQKPDIVLTYTIKPNIYGGYICGRKKIPYITTITGIGSMFQKKGPVKKLITGMYKAGLKKAEVVFFQNDENRRLFNESGIYRGDTILVPGSGVNLSIHTFEPYPEDDKTVFLFVGRIMKEKGIDEYFEAAKKYHSDNTEFQILGYCDDDYNEQLKELSDKGVIKHFDFTTDVHGYLKACSALVLPTYHEGMSNVLQEAASVGRPVIASDIPGCHEIFEDGITGLSCKPKDSESLIDAIGRFLLLSREERAKMGKLGREKMEKEFDRRIVLRSYKECVDKILSEETK